MVIIARENRFSNISLSIGMADHARPLLQDHFSCMVNWAGCLPIRLGDRAIPDQGCYQGIQHPSMFGSSARG